MNPLALLGCSLSVWLSVLSVNQLWFSLLVIGVSIAVAPRRSFVLLGLTVPLLGSILIIHAPQGNTDVALALGARASALIASLLATATYIRVTELAKALQGLGASSKLTYILGNAINMLPLGSRYATVYRESMHYQGKHLKIRYVVFPLITRMLVMSAARELPLATSGVLLPGPRTVLRPVPFRPRDWAVTGLGLLLVVSCVVCSVLGLV